MPPVGPFDFSLPQASAGVVVSGDERDWAIELNSPAWAYGCVFASLSGLKRGAILQCDIEVQSGSATIGVLAANQQFFADELTVSAKRGWQPVHLQLPPDDARGPLVLRNATGQTCRLRLRPGSVLEDSHNVLATKEIRAVQELIEAGYYLNSALPDNSVLSNLARDAVVDVIGPLARRMNLSLCSPDDPGFSDWLKLIDDDLLIALALAMVRPANCDASPGWQFDSALIRPEPYWQLRAAIWRAVKERCPTHLFDLPWLGGTRARMPLGSDLSVALFTLGQFEPNMFHELTSMLRAGDVFIDVGANEGLYSLLAASIVGHEGLVLAIEPSPRELQRLHENVTLNAFEDRVVVVETALSSVAGWSQFTIAHAEHGGQNALAHQFSQTSGAAARITMTTLTLDMLTHRLPGRVPDFVKIDVEGAEYDVLCGADWVIEQARPIWFIEIGRTGSDADIRVVNRLADADYALFAVDDRLGKALGKSRDADWARVENMIAVPSEKLAGRWPDAPLA